MYKFVVLQIYSIYFWNKLQFSLVYSRSWVYSSIKKEEDWQFVLVKKILISKLQFLYVH